MSTKEVYQEIEQFMAEHLEGEIGKRTLKRLVLLVIGIVNGLSAAPAQMAEAISELGLNSTSVESIERRIRRVENDPIIQAIRCFKPIAKAILERCHMQELLLILDPTAQKDHLVMVSINIWYRGRSLPIAWTIWPGNVPLEGASFWERITVLLETTSEMLPSGVPVTIMADRAFGTPAFTDLVAAHGWHWIVRVQDQTHYRDRCGREKAIAHLVSKPGQRKKLSGWAFKKAGWRNASLIAFWGQRHRRPLCLVSDLHPSWNLVALYRRRFPIECTFRDYKSYGWHWEQGQVRNLDHMQRLLVGMAIATWMTILIGAHFAETLLAKKPTRKRHTRSWYGKKSLFRLGLIRWKAWFRGLSIPCFPKSLLCWDASNWSSQFRAHHARAFVFA